MFLKDFLSEEAIYELNKIKEADQKINRDYLIYKTGHKNYITYDFKKKRKEQDAKF